MRFIADPDFWLDWIVYGAEFQMGIGMGLGLMLFQIKSKYRQTYAAVILGTIFVLSWLFFVK